MKRELVWTLILLGAVLTGKAVPPVMAEPAGKTVIRLATLAPKDSSPELALRLMGEKWRERTAGHVELRIYSGAAMGSESALVSRMRIGQIEAAMLTASGLGEIEPEVNALQKMPMMFRSLEEVDFVRAKLQAQLEQRLLQRGYVVLFWGDAGWVRFFCREPALRPGDVRRLKMFVGAGDNEQIDLMRAAGLQVVPLEWKDALTSLQTGMIDCVPTIPLHANAGQFYTVTKHMLELNWVPLVGATIIVKRVWDRLPAETRETLLQAARESGAEITARSRAESDEAVQAMREKWNLRVHAVSPELEAEWRREAESFYPQICGALVPAPMCEEARRLLTEYRSRAADGER